MHQEIIMAGTGGDGVLLMGQLLAHAALLEDKNVVWFPSYGPESRGGSADCNVILSTGEIGSPIIATPDTLIALNQAQLDKYAPTVKSGGLIVLNCSLAVPPKDKTGCRVISIPASDIADKAGTVRATNMVMLGCYIAAAKSVAMESILAALPEVLPPHRHNLLPVNQLALERGAEMGAG
ncbi:MAG: 2-oxoacid:acceptor oxidoreductase family protein [Armatimonadota bacterium]|nr:2-oxoacid:acceptor oxidoreductase family protein [Armatimonadota bacterium]